jgi:Iron-sulfur cluster-binding domain
MGTVVVLADGNVNFCCYSSVIVGNVHLQTFNEIWTGPVMTSIRQELSSGTLPPQCRSLSCPVFRGDQRNLPTAGLDALAQLQERFRGTGLSVTAGAGSPELVLDICYRGEPLRADLFIGVQYPDGVVRFLPTLEEFALPLLCGVELREDCAPLQFDLSSLPEGFPLSGDCHVSAALFASDSDPNRLSNCYWSDFQTLA